MQDFLNLQLLLFEDQNFTSIDLSNIPLGSNWSSLGANLYFSNCPFLTSIIMPHGNLGFSIGGCPYLTNIVFQNSNILYGNNIMNNCNSLTTFDISNISNVTLGSELMIGGNLQLKCVNLKNGACNNWASVLISYNPALFCVQVDNPTFCINAELINTWQWLDLVVNPSLCQYSTNCTNCAADIDEVEKYTISISPNPTTSKFVVEGMVDMTGSNYYLLDQIGNMIQSGTINAQKMEIDLSRFSEGVYWLKFDNSLLPVQKIIKQ